MPEERTNSMTIDALKHIPLNSAYLCQDCDAVGNSAMRCPACASQALMGLAGVFDRKEWNREAILSMIPGLAARHVDFLSELKCGFYFHPTDEDLSAGTPVEEKAT